MDAIIGRYRLRMEDDGTLVLQHPTGILFDLTADEVLELMDFIRVYRKALMAIERDTEGEIERVRIRGTADQRELQVEQ
jgi:hypothetical protein